MVKNVYLRTQIRLFLVTMAYEVTIGIPVYNVEKYIRSSLESALAQTFRSIEFLICDDCGTDSSMEIVKGYQTTHSRGADIRIVRQPHNMGLGEARNRLIAEAKGKYIYFMDSDDVIVTNAIELLYSNAIRNNADIVYGSMDKLLTYENDRRFHYRSYPTVAFLKENEFANYVYRTYDGIQASTCNFLINLDVYRKNGLKYKAINYWEDFTTTMDLPTYIDRAVLLSDMTYLYICREGTMSNYQKRDSISKNEIVKTMDAISEIKSKTDRLRGKPYFSRRCYKLMMTCFFINCTILKDIDLIKPSFTNKEIRDFMKSPMRFSEILEYKANRAYNLFLYVLGVLPPFLTVKIIEVVGKRKGLINN